MREKTGGGRRSKNPEREILEMDGSIFRHPVPPDLKALPKYAEDAKLCARWMSSISVWRAAYPDVDALAEVRKAYAYEAARGFPKKDRVRYLQGWLSRAQDWAERRGGSGYVSQRPYLHSGRSPEPPRAAPGFDLDREMDGFMARLAVGSRIAGCDA